MIRLNRIMISSLLFEHDLFGKPVPTFPDHALIGRSCHESHAHHRRSHHHRIIEQEATFLPALEMLPGLTPELLAENRPWMREAAALDAQDVLILCFQSYVVKTPHHTILVDSCIGNDKPRPRPKWNMKTDDTYMRALAAVGISAGDIDFVMCTHLHVDHVGWNTRLENGSWVPTFPNARYVFARNEFDYWTEQHAKTP